MKHGIAYVKREQGASESIVLTKCCQVVFLVDTSTFDWDCADCVDAWPSEEQQIAAGFTTKTGKAFDKLVGRSR